MTATMAPPDRSLSQRMDALGRANAIRVRRGVLKRDLKAGRASVVPLLESPPEWIGTMPVFDLLLALPKFGRVKATTALSKCQVSARRSVGGLSPRQRTELLAYLCGQRGMVR